MFTRPEYVPAALKALQGTMLGGKPLRAYPLNSDFALSRRRGMEGLREAGERGILTGDGPDAGISGGAKNVIMYGLPGKMTPLKMSDNLRDFRLAGSEQGRPVVVKIERCVPPTPVYTLLEPMHVQCLQ